MEFFRNVTVLAAAAAAFVVSSPLSLRDAAAENTTISYWTFLPYGGERPREKGETAVIDAFMQENPDIKVNVEVLPWNEIHKKFLATFAAGQGPDVLRVEAGGLPLLAKAGALGPLDDFLRDWDAEERSDFFDWDGTVIGGKKLALPIAANVFTLLYRTDLFEEKGLKPPASWAEFVKTANALTSDEGWGFAYAVGQEGSYAQALVPPFIWGAGGEVLEEDGRAAFDSAEAAEGVKFLVDLVQVHKVAPPEVTSFNLEDVMQGFMAGRYAMIIDGANRYSTIQGSDITRGKVGIAHIPSKTGDAPAPSYSTGGWMLGINARSDKQEAAAKFAKFYAGREGQALIAEVAGDFPARKSTFKEPFMAIPEKAYLQEFAEILATSAKGPLLSVRFDELLGVHLIPAIHRIFAGADAQTELRAAATRFNEK